jgi:Domain of unknown function (DUF1995)
MQSALTARQSRLAVVLPAGARLGMEKAGVSETVESSNERGDRELARCIVGLFEGTELSCCAVFATRNEMDAAVKKFGPLIECAFDYWTESVPSRGSVAREKKSRKFAGRQAGGFGAAPPAVVGGAAKGGNEVVVATAPGAVIWDSSTEFDVYIVVAPRQGSMARVRQLCSQFGDEKLVILANTRVDDMRGLPLDVASYFCNSEGKSGDSIGTGSASTFEDVYYWKPDPSPKFVGGVLFRSFPDDWVLCRAAPLAGLKRLLESPTRPSADAIADALRAEADKPTAGIMDNVTKFLGKIKP